MNYETATKFVRDAASRLLPMIEQGGASHFLTRRRDDSRAGCVRFLFTFSRTIFSYTCANS